MGTARSLLHASHAAVPVSTPGAQYISEKHDMESLSSDTPGLDTHSKGDSAVQPQHCYVLFSRTREEITLTVTKLLKSCVQLAPAFLPAVVSL